ncbi:HNH endonuclease [Pseudomonas juntendi]|uniref:HNH endonuclease n=1 Tax=Pseudomonas juntendi TaxID=2666183 RepID=UPI003B4376A5
MLSQKELKRMLHYCPETGVFTWAIDYWGHKIGEPIGTINTAGYVEIYLKGKTYKAHRLAYLYMEGEHPTGVIDHHDMVRHNNIYTNLRLCSVSQNAWNMRISPKNTSGFKGVFYDSAGKRWRAQIKVDGKAHNLGSFRTAEEANAAVIAKREQLHGEFCNHGSAS